MSLIGRIHHIVQRLITTGNEADAPPTTIAIQKEVFKENFNSDSRTQRDAVYGSVIRGRDNAIIGWESYTNDPKFLEDLLEVEF